MSAWNHLDRLVSSSLLPSQEIDDVGDAGTGVAFKVRQSDVQALLSEFSEVVDAEDLQ